MSTEESTHLNRVPNSSDPDWDKHIEAWQKTDKFVVTPESIKENGAEAEMKRLKEEVEEVKKANKPIPIKAVGNQRKEVSIQEMEEEIKEKANFSEGLTLAKQYFKEHKEEVEKQINSMVAFYNIGDKNAFFFVTPQEARLAIDHVKSHRDGEVKRKKIQEKVDQLVDDGIEWALNESEGRELESIDDVDQDVIVETVRQYIDNKNKRLKSFSYSAVVQDPDLLTLNFLNKIMSFVEHKDLTVDGIMVNANRFADIRSWGATVYDRLSRREMESRKKDKSSAVAELWTGDVYRCNILTNNQIVLYSSYINTFFCFNMVKSS
jgi:hypothetical protein